MLPIEDALPLPPQPGLYSDETATTFSTGAKASIQDSSDRDLISFASNDVGMTNPQTTGGRTSELAMDSPLLPSTSLPPVQSSQSGSDCAATSTPSHEISTEKSISDIEVTENNSELTAGYLGVEYFRELKRKLDQPKPRRTEAQKERELRIEQLQWMLDQHKKTLETASEGPQPHNGEGSGIEDTRSNQPITVTSSIDSDSEPNNDSSGEDNDIEAALEEYERARDEFKSKKKAGIDTLDDEIEYIRAKRAWRIREEKMKRDAETDSEDEVRYAARAKSMTNQRQSLLANLNAEIAEAKVEGAESQEETEESEDSFSDSSRVHKSPKPKGNKRPAKANKKTPQKKRQKKNAGSKRTMEPPDFSDLFARDTLAAAQRNSGKGNQPSFKSDSKATMFKNLMASIPKADRADVRADREMIDQASKGFRKRGDCMPVKGTNMWKLKGLNTQLFNHQMVGVSWMIEREASETEPFGGILADEMGIGKTVIALGNIVNAHRSEKISKNRQRTKPTLIVVPSSVAIQWEREVMKHIEGQLTRRGAIFDTLVFKRSRMKNITEPRLDWLQSYGIVICSYHEMMSQFPRNEPPIELETEEQRHEWWKHHLEKTKGILFQIEWHRIIFDEAHYLRNPDSKTAAAATHLKSKLRWLMTGTVLINRVVEFYSYFKVLHYATGGIKAFRRNFVNTDEARMRLRAFLSIIMKRRTHEDKLLNKAIIELPKSNIKTEYLEFSPIEKAVYDFVNERFIEKIQENIGNTDKDSRFSHIFTLILRLRQLASHLYLIQEAIEGLLQMKDIERLMEIVEEELERDESYSRESLRRFYNSLGKNLNNPGSVPVPAAPQDDPEDSDSSPEGSLSTNHNNHAVQEYDVGEAFGNQFVTFKKPLEHMAQNKTREETEVRIVCNVCGRYPEDAQVSDCNHLYCRHCMQSLKDALTGHKSKKKRWSTRCSKCRKMIANFRPCNDAEKLEQISRQYPQGSKANNEEDDWLSQNGHLFPAQKFLALKAQILRWLEEAPNDKIIVFSQFVKILQYAARMIAAERIGVVEYHGLMTHQQRDKVLRDFQREPDLSVLFISFSTGGVGLNLTMANKCVLLEPWWNNAMESQAYCRVLRLGQEKTTSIVRFVIKDSIEKRLLQISSGKSAEISTVMGSKDRVFREKAYQLFGLNPDGSEYIWPDDRSHMPQESKESKDTIESGNSLDSPVESLNGDDTDNDNDDVNNDEFSLSD